MGFLITNVLYSNNSFERSNFFQIWRIKFWKTSNLSSENCNVVERLLLHEMRAIFKFIIIVHPIMLFHLSWLFIISNSLISLIWRSWLLNVNIQFIVMSVFWIDDHLPKLIFHADCKSIIDVLLFCLFIFLLILFFRSFCFKISNSVRLSLF